MRAYLFWPARLDISRSAQGKQASRGAQELRTKGRLEYFTNQLVKYLPNVRRPLERDEMEQREAGVTLS